MEKYRSSIVLMTALLPTIGHKRLIEYAAELSHEVNVIISGRSFEPISVHTRGDCLSKDMSREHNVKFHIHEDDSAPQNPSGSGYDRKFWEYWMNVITTKTGYGIYDSDIAVVSSEPYGDNIAKCFSWDFVPYDIDRQIDGVKGSNVRSDVRKNWEYIIPSMQFLLKSYVTIMGPESCGKTTLAKDLAEYYNGYFIPEWARPYLETVGPNITPQKMDIISKGQFALEMHASENLNDKPFIFLDTDILSTIGYYEIWDKHYTREEKFYSINNIDFVNVYRPADLYIILSDNIPFVKDPLRYGGDKRESNTQFWIDLAERENLNYVVLETKYHSMRMQEAISHIDILYNSKVKNIEDFERE